MEDRWSEWEVAMRYFGGKTRTCKSISEIINNTIDDSDCKMFVSPFVGGGWVEQYVKGGKVLNDKHRYLMKMYKQLQMGWKPPTELSKEEYDHIKNNQDENPHLTGFVGFGCSFAGKWFGGYAKDKSGRNYCLNAHNSINRKIANGLLDDSEITCVDYQDLQPKNAVIYCDPPYKGTTQYDKNIVGEFNHNVFWEVVRQWSKDNIVFVSEYNAPDDFTEVWRKDVKLDIRNKDNKKENRVEKLFQYAEK